MALSFTALVAMNPIGFLPVSETMQATSILQATEIASREGKEGVVARVIGTENLVKIKQDDYLQMHRAMFNYGAKAVVNMFRNAKIVWPEIAKVSETNTCFAIPKIKQFVEIVRVPEVVRERAQFLDSIIVPQAIEAANAYRYIKALPSIYFSIGRTEAKRRFAREIASHTKCAQSVPQYLFAALDSRLDSNVSDKLTETFVNVTAKSLERAFAVKDNE